jgi:poly(hydroxyalkanoate) depolymerase family esterase
MNNTVQTLMREATRLTQAGRLHEATEAIQRALRGTAAMPVAPDGDDGDEALVLDGCVFEVETPDAPPPTPAHEPPPAAHSFAPTHDAAAGDFSWGTHTEAGLTRRYKLYVPPGTTGRALPLVVMLHGCTQDPDDFAAGTGMNERAREQGFAVLYPAQAAEANPQRCWNWFKHNHQRRGHGEPALIAGMTRAVMQRHGIDARRVFIAGLSAGGAMAALVAATYPELYAAVGVHSGLPAGCAGNLPEALAAMNGAAPPASKTKRRNAAAGPSVAVPTIVFHGDGDKTVHPRNGEQLINDMLNAGVAAPHPRPAPQVQQGVSARGQRYTRSTHHGGAGAESLAEHWLVHGAGHAWSGGDRAGSYTDASGPDATREMLRFFFEHPHRHSGG